MFSSEASVVLYCALFAPLPLALVALTVGAVGAVAVVVAEEGAEGRLALLPELSVGAREPEVHIHSKRILPRTPEMNIQTTAGTDRKPVVDSKKLMYRSTSHALVCKRWDRGARGRGGKGDRPTALRPDQRSWSKGRVLSSRPA